TAGASSLSLHDALPIFVGESSDRLLHGFTRRLLFRCSLRLRGGHLACPRLSILSYGPSSSTVAFGARQGRFGGRREFDAFRRRRLQISPSSPATPGGATAGVPAIGPGLFGLDASFLAGGSAPLPRDR